jgi:hypothetical protein
MSTDNLKPTEIEGANSQQQRDEISASIRDKTPPVWDMSQERAFIETLLNQRFNFFLFMFSLVIAGGINSKKQVHLQIILTIGAVITILLASLLVRSQEKLDIMLKYLFADKSHPAAIVNALANPKGSRRRLLGIYIPIICCLLLVTGAIMAWFDVLKVVSEP